MTQNFPAKIAVLDRDLAQVQRELQDPALTPGDVARLHALRASLTRSRRWYTRRLETQENRHNQARTLHVGVSDPVHTYDSTP